VTEKAKTHPITIDLNQFKLHIALKNRIEVTLHFNSPSRRFYLSVIAFVVNEMKKLGKITSIPLEGRHELLALLNDTVGGSAGSSDKENLLPRIYRKWQHALPNLEEAPLFKVLGRRKEYDEGTGKTYPFTEAEKDSWANLFEYKGSEENVRLKFAVDRIGASLDDVDIIYEDCLNGNAWERFISSLRDKVEVKHEKEDIYEIHQEPVAQVSPLGKWRTPWPSQYRWAALIVAIGVVAGAAAIAIWGFYFRHTSQPEVAPKEKIASLQHEKPSVVVPPSTEVPTTPTPPLEVASKERMAFPLPDKPSIAVLPFVNMSGDPNQEYFSDGITEDLITDLSKISGLFVIASNSSFTYKKKQVKIRQIAEDLGVRYVLEGSVQKSGEQVRINVQLVDTTTGHHIWAERYTGKMRDIFALQDRITRKIVSALAVKLTTDERERTILKETENIEAYELFLKGRGHHLHLTPDDFGKARSSLEKAIELDPNYARAYAALAMVYWQGTQIAGMFRGLGEKSWHEARLKSNYFLSKAMKKPTSIAHLVASEIYLSRRQYDEAVAEINRAMALDPNGGHTSMGYVLNMVNRPGEATDILKKGMRIDPYYPANYIYLLGMAHFCMGQFQDATSLAETARKLNPERKSMEGLLAATYAQLGREEEAQAALTTYRKNAAAKDLKMVMYFWPFRDPAVADCFAEGLVKAGLPRGPFGAPKILNENRLKGEEIRSLIFGRKGAGRIMVGTELSFNFTEDGKATLHEDTGSDTGKIWVENDIVCVQWENIYGGLPYCATVFRDPEGTPERKNEYLWVTDVGFLQYSPLN